MKVYCVYAPDGLVPLAVSSTSYRLLSCQGSAVTLVTRYLPAPQGTGVLPSVRHAAWDRSTGSTSLAPEPLPCTYATRPEPPQRGTMKEVVAGVGGGLTACSVMSQLSAVAMVPVPVSEVTSWFVPACEGAGGTRTHEREMHAVTMTGGRLLSQLVQESH